MALAGYLFAALAKPLIGFASSWHGVLGARFLDRLGTGLRSAPRDALIASSVTNEHRGKAFGLEGIGDNLGACLGPLIAVLLLAYFGVDMRLIFVLAVDSGAARLLYGRTRARAAAVKRAAETKTASACAICPGPIGIICW